MGNPLTRLEDLINPEFIREFTTIIGIVSMLGGSLFMSWKVLGLSWKLTCWATKKLTPTPYQPTELCQKLIDRINSPQTAYLKGSNSLVSGLLTVALYPMKIVMVGHDGDLLDTFPEKDREVLKTSIHKKFLELYDLDRKQEVEKTRNYMTSLLLNDQSLPQNFTDKKAKESTDSILVSHNDTVVFVKANELPSDIQKKLGVS